jgi:predicted  nucleic acid-binding Zn-ribbon protein
MQTKKRLNEELEDYRNAAKELAEQLRAKELEIERLEIELYELREKLARQEPKCKKYSRLCHQSRRCMCSRLSRLRWCGRRERRWSGEKQNAVSRS